MNLSLVPLACGAWPCAASLLSLYRRGLNHRYKATWKREFELPWRKAGLPISMIKWTRTSRLSIKISLSLVPLACGAWPCTASPLPLYKRGLNYRRRGPQLRRANPRPHQLSPAQPCWNSRCFLSRLSLSLFRLRPLPSAKRRAPSKNYKTQSCSERYSSHFKKNCAAEM